MAQRAKDIHKLQGQITEGDIFFTKTKFGSHEAINSQSRQI